MDKNNVDYSEIFWYLDKIKVKISAFYIFVSITILSEFIWFYFSLKNSLKKLVWSFIKNLVIGNIKFTRV